MLSLVPFVEGEEEKACFIRLAPSLRRLWMQKASYSSSTCRQTQTAPPYLINVTGGEACAHTQTFINTHTHTHTRERERELLHQWNHASLWSLKPCVCYIKISLGMKQKLLKKKQKNFQLPSKLFWMCSHLTGIHSWMPNAALGLCSIQ